MLAWAPFVHGLIVASFLPLAGCGEGKAESALRVVYLEPKGNPDPGIEPFRTEFNRQVLPRHPRARMEVRVIPADSPDQISPALEEVRANPPAVIVTAHAEIAQAIARDLPGTPLVLATMADPMQLGIVDHDLSTTTNVTGITDYIPYELKHIELLHELSPSIRHIGIVSDKYWSLDPVPARVLRESADLFGVRVSLVVVEAVAEIEQIGRFAEKGKVDAWFVVDTPFNRSNAVLVSRAVVATGKPSIGGFAWHARKGGGMMAYAHIRSPAWPRIGEMVKLILSGVPARDMPFDRPKRFELIVNRERARAIGMEIPRSILMRADELIQ